MFDFAFSELLVICVVALVVLGPTRLPGLVRKVGRWVGKARAMARDFREQLENEVNLEELTRAAKSQQKSTPPAADASANAATMADAPSPPGTAPAAAAAAAPVGTPDEGAGTQPDVTEVMARSGYPYGMPTDTSSSSADPAVTGEGAPADDTYSHAHAAGDEPQPWSPDTEPPAAADAAPAARQDATADADAADASIAAGERRNA